jgi:AraC family transcriptional activator of pobA
MNKSEIPNKPAQPRTIESFALFTEREFTQRIEIGKVYRPAYYSIIIIKQGNLTVRHNLSEYVIHGNSLFFMLPNSIYEFSDISTDFEVCGIIYTRQFLSKNGLHLNSSSILEVFASGFQPYYTVSGNELNILVGLFNHLELTMGYETDTPFLADIKKHSFLTLFYQSVSVYRKYNAAQKVKLNRPQELSIDFLRLLSNHFKEERSVQYYAERLFVSPKHLTQMLKDITGRTAGELIDRAVIIEAKVLLRTPSYNVAQVAEELHFSDQFFFAKFFKKHTGLTPSQFRAQG